MVDFCFDYFRYSMDHSGTSGKNSIIQTYLTKDCRDVECEFDVFQAQHKWPYEIEHRGLHITIVVMVFLCLFLKVTYDLDLGYRRNASVFFQN